MRMLVSLGKWSAGRQRRRQGEAREGKREEGEKGRRRVEHLGASLLLTWRSRCTVRLHLRRNLHQLDFAGKQWRLSGEPRRIEAIRQWATAQAF